MDKKVLSRNIREWIDQYPLIEKMINLEELVWINNDLEKFEEVSSKLTIEFEDIKEAEDRLDRFRPFLIKSFPELEKSQGIIESNLKEIKRIRKDLKLPSRVFLKEDNKLAIAGSVKARGGIYEVLKYTEDLLKKEGKLSKLENYGDLADKRYRKFFSDYTIQVGSTGNLGLSIGIISSKIGYKVIVHMSHDAEEWKKDLLREKGVKLVEYDSDYSEAVKIGRMESEKDPKSYFVDDENSQDLFIGYSVAALRLKKQLDDLGIEINSSQPLVVHLPCGVGGAPGGIAYGLKLIFKDNVHCFFAEPTHSPAMLLSMYTDQGDKLAVQDFGIDNITDADGLAVGRASSFVSKTLRSLLSGIYTIDDRELYRYLRLLLDREDVYLEPSACAGFKGLELLEIKESIENFDNSIQIVWATGGNLVPNHLRKEHYNKLKD